MLAAPVTFINHDNFQFVREAMRAYAESHSRPLAKDLVPATGSVVVARQIEARSGSPSSLGQLSASERQEIAKLLGTATHVPNVAAPVAQAVVDNWVALDRRYGRVADDHEIVADAIAVAKNKHAGQAALRARIALQIMLHGSRAVSRSVSYATPFTRTPPLVKDPREFNRISERNFERAARFVITNAKKLPVCFETAARINAILTRGLLMPGAVGKLFKGDAAMFDWIAQDAAKCSSDPIGFAEKLHYEVSRADAFFDGNGRTARLMADLVLLKNGLPPAYYVDITDYFNRGSVRAPTSRLEKEHYFRRLVDRGVAITRRAERLAGTLKAPPDSKATAPATLETAKPA